VRDLDVRHLGGCGDQVVDETAGQRIAGFVVDEVLVEHPADALDHAARDLPLDDLRLIMRPQSSLTT
jgi:hypothetical protein